MAELERAAAEVEYFDTYISALETIHATAVAEVDWQTVAHANQPQPPQRRQNHEQRAAATLADFEPKLFESQKRQAARLESLRNELDAATARDQEDHEGAVEEYEAALADWQNSKTLAEGVFAGDTAAVAEAAHQVELIADGEYVKDIRITVAEDAPITATIKVSRIEDVVPTEQKSLLASGKLSVKEMPRGRYFGIYQDYVCGSSLLVANAVLSMLPSPN